MIFVVPCSKTSRYAAGRAQFVLVSPNRVPALFKCVKLSQALHGAGLDLGTGSDGLFHHRHHAAFGG
jgi:hypothetical protein